MGLGLFSGLAFILGVILGKLSELCFALVALFEVVEDLGCTPLLLQVVITSYLLYRGCKFVFYFS